VHYKTIHLQENPTLIPLIAQWYNNEWLIPTETSIDSLKEKLNKTTPLQIVLFLVKSLLPLAEFMKKWDC
jgi:hypothetical protein